MPRLVPDAPVFVTASEQQVWERLRDALTADAVLLANLRLADETKDHEADLVVLLPGSGFVVLEVKGGSVHHDASGWWVTRSGEQARCRPVDQARDTEDALGEHLESDPRWALGAATPGPTACVERVAVVLCVNEVEGRDRARGRLYVGMSRATDVLVVVGDPDALWRVGGLEVARQLGVMGDSAAGSSPAHPPAPVR